MQRNLQNHQKFKPRIHEKLVQSLKNKKSTERTMQAKFRNPKI